MGGCASEHWVGACKSIATIQDHRNTRVRLAKVDNSDAELHGTLRGRADMGRGRNPKGTSSVALAPQIQHAPRLPSSLCGSTLRRFTIDSSRVELAAAAERRELPAALRGFAGAVASLVPFLAIVPTPFLQPGKS